MRARAPSPSDVPPFASSSARVSACLLSTCAAGALEHRDGQAAAGDAVLADALGGREVDAGLRLVGEPDHGRPGAGLHDGAQRVGAGGEVTERPRLIPRGLRHRMYPNAYAGDDPEHAFRADHQLPQVRARRRLRRTAEIEHARQASPCAGRGPCR